MIIRFSRATTNVFIDFAQTISSQAPAVLIGNYVPEGAKRHSTVSGNKEALSLIGGASSDWYYDRSIDRVR